MQPERIVRARTQAARCLKASTGARSETPVVRPRISPFFGTYGQERPDRSQSACSIRECIRLPLATGLVTGRWFISALLTCCCLRELCHSQFQTLIPHCKTWVPMLLVRSMGPGLFLFEICELTATFVTVERVSCARRPRAGCARAATMRVLGADASDVVSSFGSRWRVAASIGNSADRNCTRPCGATTLAAAYGRAKMPFGIPIRTVHVRLMRGGQVQEQAVVVGERP